MVKCGSYVVRVPDKPKHLLVSQEDHDAIRLFARKNHLTITESVHRLLETAFAVVTKGLSKYK